LPRSMECLKEKFGISIFALVEAIGVVFENTSEINLRRIMVKVQNNPS
jgi:hypothetical protein